MTVAELTKINEIVDAAESKRTQLVGMLQDMQSEFGYLPADALVTISERLEISLQQIYGVATFYKAFSLKPKGRYIVQVCLGTACHVLGAPNILDRFARELGIDPGDTTEDMMFSLESVRCVGACSLAPVVVIGPETFGRVRQDEVPKLIDGFRVESRESRVEGWGDRAGRR